MDPAFADDQLALRDSVRALLEKECTPADVRASWTTETGRSAPRWQALADMGLLGLLVPEQFGGRGLDETWLVLLLEEAGRAALPEPLGPVSVAIGLIVDAAPEPLREEWLPRILSGEVIAVASLPSVPWVEDAHIADLLLVARDGELHVLDPAAADIVAAPASDRSRRLFTVSPRLNARSCLADRAKPAIALAEDRNALVHAAYLVGSASQLADLAASYALEHEQLDSPAGGSQAVEHQLAAAVAEIDLARPAVYRAAWSIAHDVADRSADVATARTLAAKAAHLAASTSLQLRRGIGDSEDHDLHPWLERALAPDATPR